MLEFTIIILAIGIIIILTIWRILVIREKRKQIPFDKLKHSERQLKAYKALSPTARLENYEDLRKAIGRLHTLLTQVEGVSYDKQGLLNRDYLHTDVRMLEYFTTDGQITFISISQAREINDFPKGEYKVTVPYIGKYNQNGAEKISVSLAIDNYLIGICNRWIKEISEIGAFISDFNVQKAGSH